MKKQMIEIVLGVVAVCMCACGGVTERSGRVSVSSVEKTTEISSSSVIHTSETDIEEKVPLAKSNEEEGEEDKAMEEAGSEIDYSPYRELIAKISDAVSRENKGEQVDMGEMMPLSLSYLFFHENEGNYIYGYMVKDLDDDGVDELLLGFNASDNNSSDFFDNSIMDMYTIQNGELIHVFGGGDRCFDFLCADGMIENYRHSSVDNDIWMYSDYKNGTMNPVETVFTKGEDGDLADIHWYYAEGEGSYEDLSHEISESEGTSIRSKHERLKIAYTPF
jgi:hypothetical protein